MEGFEGKFNNLLSFLGKKKSGFELCDVDVLKEGLINAGFDQVSVVSHKKKKLNGYNLYMQKRMGELKEEVADSNKRMSQISSEWKTKLSEDDRAGWKQQADEKIQAPATPVVGGAPAQKVRKQRTRDKITGYQLFVKEQMPLLKGTSGDPRARMREISTRWHAFTAEEKVAFNERASTMKPIPK